MREGTLGLATLFAFIVSLIAVPRQEAGPSTIQQTDVGHAVPFTGDLVGMLGTRGSADFDMHITANTAYALRDDHLFVVDLASDPARVVSKTPLLRVQTDDQIDGVWKNGDTILLNEGFDLWPFDVTNPAAPMALPPIRLPLPAYRHAVDGSLSFLSNYVGRIDNGTQFAILDLSDPRKPRRILEQHLPVAIRRLEAGEGHLAWSARYRSGSEVPREWRLFRMSNGSTLEPVYEERIGGNTGDLAWPFHIADGRVFLLDNGRVRILDLGLLPQRREIASWPPVGRSLSGVHYHDDRLMALEAREDAEGNQVGYRLDILALDDSTGLRQLSSYDMPIQSTYGGEGTLCRRPPQLAEDPWIVCYGARRGPFTRIYAHDLSAEGAFEPYHGFPPSIRVAGTALLVGQEGGAEGDLRDDKYIYFDQSVPGVPQRRAVLETRGPPVFLQDGSRLYALAEEGRELRVYDIARDATPTIVGTYCSEGICPSFGGQPEYVAISLHGDHLVLLTTAGSLQVVDVSDPAIIRLAASVQLEQAAQGMQRIDSDHVLVLGAAHPLLVSLLEPGAPRVIAEMEALAGASLAAQSGAIASIVIGQELHRFDTSDPAAPLPIGVHRWSEPITQLEADGSRVISQSGERRAAELRLWLVEPRATTADYVRGRFELGGSGAVAASSDRLFFAESRRRLIEVWSGLRPIELRFRSFLPLLPNL